MIIYVLGHWLSHYAFAHSEIVVCLNAAKGLRAAGRDARVLWYGGAVEHEGVPHVPIAEARPVDGDVLLVMHPVIAAQVVRQPELQHLLEAGRKWIYTNGAYGDVRPGGSTHDAEWAHYDAIFVESEQSVEKVQTQFPDKPVHLCWLGCSHDVELEHLTDPYPVDGRHLFFAGRLTHLDEMRELLQSLPPRYELWIAARALLLGERWVYVQNQGEPLPAAPEAMPECVSHEAASDMIAGIFGGDSRAHFLGALPFGTFWDRHHFAFASLDIGLSWMPPALNCKIFDAIRAVGRVITYGQSPSYFLLDKYQAGVSAPWRDYAAVRDILEGWEPESRPSRLNRALRFRDGESWHRRAQDIIEATGI